MLCVVMEVDNSCSSLLGKPLLRGLHDSPLVYRSHSHSSLKTQKDRDRDRDGDGDSNRGIGVGRKEGFKLDMSL